MAKTDVRLTRGWGRSILNSREMDRTVMAATNRVAARVRATAPRDTGAYISSISTGRVRRDRIVGVIAAGDPAALAIEARFGTMARALRAERRA